MKTAIAILSVLGLFLVFHFFIPHSGFAEVMVLIFAIGIGYAVFAAVKRSTYDAALKPLNCPQCYEPQTFRVSGEDADKMKYRRKCRKCGFEDSYDFTKDEES